MKDNIQIPRKYSNNCILNLIITNLILFTAILALILMMSHNAAAQDFGIEGHTYEIIEEDILKLIERKLQSVDLVKLNHKMQEQTEKYVNNPRAVPNITKATTNKVFYYDPTYILTADIKDHNNQLIHHGGTIVNPLKYIPLRENLIFIDGEDKAQVELALKLRKRTFGNYRKHDNVANASNTNNENNINHTNNLKIILVKGSPLSIQRKHKIWIYFDQAGIITTKLGITKVPALVTQEGLNLKITEIYLEEQENE